MNSKFIVVQVKLGYVVQNSVSFVIAGGPYKYQGDAQAVADRLNGIKKSA